MPTRKRPRKTSQEPPRSDPSDIDAAEADSDIENVSPASRATKKELQKSQRQAGDRGPVEVGGDGAWMDGCGLDEGGRMHAKHAFIQIMMSKPSWRQDVQRREDPTAVDVFRDIASSPHGGTAHFVDFLAEVNNDLAFFELEIKRTLFPADRQWYVALVNKKEDTPAKLLVAPVKDANVEGRDLYTHAEITFFRALIEAMAASPTSDQAGVPTLSISDALHLDYDPSATQEPTQEDGTQGPTQGGGGANQLLPMADRKHLIGRLTLDGWLAKAPVEAAAGIIGPRSFMALGTWLLSLPDLSEETRQEWERTL